MRSLSSKRVVTLADVCLVLMLMGRPALSQCTICENGETVSLPDNLLSIPGFPPLACGNVDTTIAFLIPNETSSDCSTVQSLGSLCGCPTRDDACTLCTNGAIASQPNNDLPFLSNLFLGYTPTCQILEAYLTSKSENDSLCFVSQRFIGDYCGCEDDDSSANEAATSTPCNMCGQLSRTSSDPNRTISLPDFPFETCGQLEEALRILLLEGSEECSLLSQGFASYCGCPAVNNPCSLCRDGSAVAFPDQPVELFRDEFAGIVPSCEIYESFVAGLLEESQDCANAQLFGTICGCPAVENHCVFCPGESMPEKYLDKVVQELEQLIGFTATCGDAEAYLQYQIPMDSSNCLLAQGHNHVCGCNDGLFSYLDADTRTKQAVLAWAPRMSAFLSLIVRGSALIMHDVLSTKTRRRAVYSQIILGMSCFDIVGAIAWAFSTMPIPTFFENGDPTYVYGARGNDATCKVQGFLFQLNFTSVFYNISLSSYYFLAIVYGWRDRKLKQSRWWLHGVPLTIGFGLAFAGIPFYQNAIFGCHIQPPFVFEATWYPMVFFIFAPIFSAIFFTTAMMARVYIKVRRQSKTAARWQLSTVLTSRKKEASSSQQQGHRRKSLVSILSNCRTKTDESQGSFDVSAVSPTNPPRQQRRASTATSNLERQVFIQSVLYLSAFYFSWTFLLAAAIEASPMTPRANELNIYGFYLTCFILAPLQGAWNCVIYFRPRLMSRWSSKRAKPASRLSSSEQQQDHRSQGRSIFKLPRWSRPNSHTGSHVASSDLEGSSASGIDPSMCIAVTLESLSESGERTETPGCTEGPSLGSAQPINRLMSGIREELAELEGVEELIEDFIGEDKVS